MKKYYIQQWKIFVLISSLEKDRVHGLYGLIYRHLHLVGATTRAGALSAPLRDRFGVLSRLEYYTAEQLQEIVIRTAEVLETEIDPQAATEIARRSRGTPRIANRFLNEYGILLKYEETEKLR